MKNLILLLFVASFARSQFVVESQQKPTFPARESFDTVADSPVEDQEPFVPEPSYNPVEKPSFPEREPYEPSYNPVEDEGPLLPEEGPYEPSYNPVEDEGPLLPERGLSDNPPIVEEEITPVLRDDGFDQSGVPEEELGPVNPQPGFEKDAAFEPDYVPDTNPILVILSRPRRPFGSNFFNDFFGFRRPTPSFSFPQLPQFPQLHQFPQSPQLPQFPRWFPQNHPDSDYEDQDYTPSDFTPSFFDSKPTFPFFPSLFKPPQGGEQDTKSIFHPLSGHPVFQHTLPDFDTLPDDYSNTTHDVHDIDGQKVSVNQTIRKSSGPNHNIFVHHKIIYGHPQEDQQPPQARPEVVDEAEMDQGRGDVPVEREPLDTSYVSESENEIRTPKRLVQLDSNPVHDAAL